jgi:pyruvate/2-oxoglutarate dehydrogenase complex dihydrolipoamide dehydrogenase (E3) component
MKTYDLCVIGAGSGGLVAATTGHRLGLKTVLLEKNKIGGECTHSGCVPSKTIIHSSKQFHAMKHAERYGLPSPNVDASFEFGAVMEHVDQVVQSIYANEQPETFQNMGIDVIVHPSGAQFLSETRIRIGDQELEAAHTIICAGSSPVMVTPKGHETVEFLHNENFWELRDQPRSITFIGGGVIAAELGQVMRRFGSEVHIIEHNPRILKVVDDDVAQAMIDVFEQEGIHLYPGTELSACEKTERGTVAVSLVGADGPKEFETDALFMAAGRVPNVQGMQLEKSGVDYDRRGIKVNEYLQTSAPNIYACGDVASPEKFTHVASYQADICVHNILHGNSRTNDLEVLPWAIFTDPEIAHVGLTERDARASHDGIQVLRVDATLDRYVTEGKTTGFVKIILGAEDRILGADAIGAHSGEWIQLVSMALKTRMPIQTFADTIVAYPTFSEIVKKAFVRHLRTRS